jgi:hypothetical protein
MGVRYVLDSRYDPDLAASPILEAIATGGGSVRVTSVGGDARVAFCQPMGEPTTVSLMTPSARRLDFSVGLPEAYPDLDSVVVLVHCMVGSKTVETVERVDATAWGGRWHGGSLDIASLGAGYGSLTLAARAVGLSGSSSARRDEVAVAWSGLEFVFADCPARRIERGYAIQPAGRSHQGSPAKSPAEVLSLDVISRAREVAFEIRAGSRRMVRRLVFGPDIGSRNLLVDLGEAASGEVTVVSDSAYFLSSSKTAYCPRAPECQYDLVYSGDMYVFENSAATARAVCVDRLRIESGDSQGSRILLASGIMSRIPDVQCGEARIVSYEPERIEIMASADRDCYLLFQDAYYPGWRAYVDGSETELFMTDVGTRALEVASGEHRVVMKFRPTNLWIGLALTCLGLVLGILYAAKGRFSARP